MADATASPNPIVRASAQKLDELLKINGISSLASDISEAIQNNRPIHIDRPPSSVELGALCKVKTLYEGPPKCQCCINWVEEQPEDLKDSIEEQTESKKHAILIRMKKNHGEGKPLVLHSIVVQNAYLKQLLGEVFSSYNGITTTLKKLVFRQPFNEFFYEWRHFSQLCESQTDPENQSLGRLLRDVLAEDLGEKMSQSEDLIANGVITFDYLWTIFKPGIEIYISDSEHDFICKLTTAEYGEIEKEPCFMLKAYIIDCNGSKFGWKRVCMGIFRFPGTKKIVQLDAVPTFLHPRAQELKEKAEARGRAARDYQTVSYHYAAYRGMARDKDRKKFNVDGRIIIDASAYELFNPGAAMSLKPLDSLSSEVAIDVSDKSQNHKVPVFPTLTAHDFHRHLHGEVFNEARQEVVNMDKYKPPSLPSLPDEYLHLCSPEVRGYCLQTKKWATFDVDTVELIQWNTNAFEDLVIAADHKRLILAFVQSQVANKHTFDDVIQGKGQGLIILLEGNPGVGKTLTAEAIADRIQRPLYMLSGSELGENARELEAKLTMILAVATKWDAVLLLDECDVFLEKRSMNNLSRNSTVAVFLRLLEYYRGILFMTTNRVGTIDPAFRSRIHLVVDYPKLNYEARRQVWTKFIRTHCPDASMTDDELGVLARAEINGREIKNLVKTAQLLARHEESALTAEHFYIVTSVFKRNSLDNCDGMITGKNNDTVAEDRGMGDR